jgi:hypothetical protein
MMTRRVGRRLPLVNVVPHAARCACPNPVPTDLEGLCVGKSGKNLLTLETSDLQNSWINSWIIFGMESLVSWEGNIHEEILMNLIHFANLLIIRENNSRIRLLFANLLSISGWLETCEVQGIRNLRSSGIWWGLNSGTIVSGDFHE